MLQNQLDAIYILYSLYLNRAVIRDPVIFHEHDVKQIVDLGYSSIACVLDSQSTYHLFEICYWLIQRKFSNQEGKKEIVLKSID